MNQGKYVFSQLCQFIPRKSFEWFVKKYDGNKYVKTFTCWNHLLVMVFGQLSNRESLRDLVSTLNAHRPKFHHLGFGESVTRSNLSKANEIREVKIFEDMANLMIATARSKRSTMRDFFLDGNVYAFDSSTISLCLSTFWWSKLHHDKGGIKLHTLLDVKTDIPAFNIITDAGIHDSKVMHLIPYEEKAFYIFDRAYMDTRQLRFINSHGSFFVVREKRKMTYDVVKDRDYNNPETGIMADQEIRFRGQKPKKQYPEVIRRVAFYDNEGNRTFIFYTNNLHITPEHVALLYKHRWRVELFYKWLKQHLRIKEFYGTSENAVKVQIYAAIISYCLVAIVEHELKLEMDTYDVLRILTISLLDKTELIELFKREKRNENYQNDTQLKLKFF
jgi:hypothetical protein